MPIRRKTPPVIVATSLEDVVNEMNKLFTDIYDDINIMNNKLSLYLDMIQDSESGKEGSIRLAKQATSDKSELKYQLLGRTKEGWAKIVENIELTTSSDQAMEAKSKSIDTDKPRYSKRQLR